MEKEKFDIVVDEKNKHFNYRAAGILFRDENVLLQITNKSDGYEGYKLIGGKVKFNESAESAIKREFFEELGINVETVRLIKVLDHKVKTSNEVWQQVVLVFSVHEKSDVFTNEKGYDWVSLQNLSKIILKPNIFNEDSGKIYSQDID